MVFTFSCELREHLIYQFTCVLSILKSGSYESNQPANYTVV